MPKNKNKDKKKKTNSNIFGSFDNQAKYAARGVGTLSAGGVLYAAKQLKDCKSHLNIAIGDLANKFEFRKILHDFIETLRSLQSVTKPIETDVKIVKDLKNINIPVSTITFKTMSILAFTSHINAFMKEIKEGFKLVNDNLADIAELGTKINTTSGYSPYNPFSRGKQVIKDNEIKHVDELSQQLIVLVEKIVKLYSEYVDKMYKKQYL